MAGNMGYDTHLAEDACSTTTRVIDASLISEMKDMAEESRRLKRMYAEMSMRNDLLKEAFGKSVKAVSRARGGHERGRISWGQHSTCMPGI
jgi:putative transposase